MRATYNEFRIFMVLSGSLILTTARRRIGEETSWRHRSAGASHPCFYHTPGLGAVSKTAQPLWGSFLSCGGLSIRRRLEFLLFGQPKVGMNPLVAGRAQGGVRNEANIAGAQRGERKPRQADTGRLALPGNKASDGTKPRVVD